MAYWSDAGPGGRTFDDPGLLEENRRDSESLQASWDAEASRDQKLAALYGDTFVGYRAVEAAKKAWRAACASPVARKLLAELSGGAKAAWSQSHAEDCVEAWFQSGRKPTLP